MIISLSLRVFEFFIWILLLFTKESNKLIVKLVMCPLEPNYFISSTISFRNRIGLLTRVRPKCGYQFRPVNQVFREM